MVQKSQTSTWDVKNPVNIGLTTNLNWLAGFLPSTVLSSSKQGKSDNFFVQNGGPWLPG